MRRSIGGGAGISETWIALGTGMEIGYVVTDATN